MTASQFYRAFEDQHRGPQSLIKERLRVYMDLIAPHYLAQKSYQTLDLGCGRGEWLSVLEEKGISAEGIDLDPSMLADCQNQGLRVEVADALQALSGRDSGTLDLITAFHLVEHLPFEILLALIREAYRVLKPCGILLMETPNPENLVVAGCNFYLDPSHQRPIPPELLRFITEHAGFKRQHILRLQEHEPLRKATALTLWDVLSGASPDYAVLAQKEGPSALMALTDGAFRHEWGLTTESLAVRFEQRWTGEWKINQHRFDWVDGEVKRINQRLGEIEQNMGDLFLLSNNQDLERELAIAQTRLEERRQVTAQTEKALEDSRAEVIKLTQQLRHEKNLAEALESSQKELAALRLIADDWHGQILDLQRSVSWRLTAPLRWARQLAVLITLGFAKALKWLLMAVGGVLILPAAPILILAIPFVLRNPGLRDRLGRRIKRYPRLRQGLRFFARAIGWIPREATKRNEDRTDLSLNKENSLHRLSPRARAFYRRLNPDATKGKPSK